MSGIEKFSTLQPQKSPKRILKSKLLTALGATGVLAPYPQNPEHILERKILLQAPFNPNPPANVVPNPLTLDWVRRVMLNGGAMPSNTTIAALTTFEASIRAANLLSQIAVCNFFAPDGSVAARTPFLVGTGGAGLWQTSSPGGGGAADGHGPNGWGIGVTGDAQFTTMFVPATSGLAFTSMGLVLYCYQWNDSQTRQDWGAYNSVSTDGYYTENYGANRYLQIGRILITVAGTGLNGYYSGQRRSATDFQFYFANSVTPHASIGSSATPETGVIANLNFQATMGLSTDGALPGFPPVNRVYSFFAATTGLTALDDTALYNAVQALRVALVGGFI